MNRRGKKMNDIPIRCKKCGMWMRQIIEWRNGNICVYWKCPNGCKNEHQTICASNTNNVNQYFKQKE